MVEKSSFVVGGALVLWSFLALGEAPKDWTLDREIFCDHPGPGGKLLEPVAQDYDWPEETLLGQRKKLLSSSQPRSFILSSLSSFLGEKSHVPFHELLKKDRVWIAMAGLVAEPEALSAMGLKDIVKSDSSASHQLTLALYWQDPKADLELHVVEPGGRHFSRDAPTIEPSISQLIPRPDQGQVSVFTAPVLLVGDYRVFVRCRLGCGEKSPVPVALMVKRFTPGQSFLVSHSHTQLFYPGDTRTIWRYRHVIPGRRALGLTLTELEMRWNTWRKTGQYELALRSAMELGPQQLAPLERRRLQVIAGAYEGLKETKKQMEYIEKINALDPSESISNR